MNDRRDGRGLLALRAAGIATVTCELMHAAPSPTTPQLTFWSLLWLLFLLFGSHPAIGEPKGVEVVFFGRMKNGEERGKVARGCWGACEGGKASTATLEGGGTRRPPFYAYDAARLLPNSATQNW